MAVKRYGAELHSFCESVGLTEIRRLRQLENHFHILDQKFIDDWISVQESELKDESISIAHKALANSILARNIAIVAIVVSTVSTIAISVINHFAK